MFDGRKRVVVKVGSSLLVDDHGELREPWLEALARDIVSMDTQVLIVSSGAVALGRKRLGLSGPLSLAQKQACAAAGQSRLTQGYERAFATHDRVAAQALLTLDDTEVRRRWLNGRRTLDTLLDLGAVPVINENDTVATDEIRYGDNDRLAARAAQMVGADLLVLLSDVDGLYDADPRTNETATHIPVVETLDADILALGGSPGTRHGTGGMTTKLLAARIATDAGCEMVICDGRNVGALSALASGARHTLFHAARRRRARASWIAGSLSPQGEVHVDMGAVAALQAGSSLLSVGVRGVMGEFAIGDTISVVGPDGEIARGLSRVASDDAESAQKGRVVMHRDDMVML